MCSGPVPQQPPTICTLFIGTVNLDAGRSVIWNIGAIAASDYPQKMTLIHELLRASSAIPVAFPPVIISVEAEGKQYDELHVDGGTGSQVFVYPAAVDWRVVTGKLKVQGRRRCATTFCAACGGLSNSRPPGSSLVF